MRIRKKSVLIITLTFVQLGCMLFGLAWFCGWLHSRLEQVIRTSVMDQNVQIAGQMANFIEALGTAHIEPGTKDWEAIQTLIEKTSLPNHGFLCITRLADGRLLCHPELRRREIDGDLPLVQYDLRDRIEDGAKSTAAGWIPVGSDVQLIGIRELPSMGVKVIAHQEDRGIQEAIALVLRPVILIGTVVSLALFVVTGFVVATTVQKYDNRIAKINAGLELQVERRGQALMKTRDAVIHGLAKLAESRDDDTGKHLDRVREYVRILGTEAAAEYAELSPSMVSLISDTSCLHDIGKVGIPDAVLCKPGKLNPEERQVIEKHPKIGGDCLQEIEKELGEDGFLSVARDITFYHHEKWDGSGYPHRLAKNAIPLAARIVAIADVYDALTSRRVYKAAMPHEKAIEIIFEGAGKHFDPHLVAALRRCHVKLLETASLLSEPEAKQYSAALAA